MIVRVITANVRVHVQLKTLGHEQNSKNTIENLEPVIQRAKPKDCIFTTLVMDGSHEHVSDLSGESTTTDSISSGGIDIRATSQLGLTGKPLRLDPIWYDFTGRWKKHGHRNTGDVALVVLDQSVTHYKDPHSIALVVFL
ncbi:hypothetical protein BDV38DRAFT_258142 [Aspergillus pseudotamarii]|uniref:Uncharacterized protein n=1 Tax=Aspergillus pseudotamarii TaxID=132259 RepID=A0A5N6SHU9_ASPPS|nr:uncharacterized protein BDV38DRAFT_258142 [Aspergillus pseudotamarii]KAE8133477.1 hypothetical protein BDV38DRAFT_258142 [Aspergillus pseudotamarii]